MNPMNNLTSIILTVHNKERLLPLVLEGILCNTTGNAELVVVLDGCTDQSEVVIDRIIHPNSFRGGYRKCITNDINETLANNVGMRSASGDYFILLQDDMVVQERGWNEKIILPMKYNSSIMAVTARDALNFKFSANPNDPMSNDFFFDFANNDNCVEGIFYVRDAVNRGPLALDARKTNQLNYFDESYCPLTWDDHDLCLRGYRSFGWLAGHFNVKYRSDTSWGTTRKGTCTFRGVPFIHSEIEKRNLKLFYSRYANCGNEQKHNADIRIY